MLIGELSKRSGMTRDTIRFYEKESLIVPVKQGRRVLPSNTYKDYPESAVATLSFIQRTKVLGFTLGEIRELLRLRSPGQKISRRWAVEAEAKLLTVEQKIQELQKLKRLLGEALTRCSDQCLDAGCEFLDRAVAKKTGSSPRRVHDDGNAHQGSCRS